MEIHDHISVWVAALTIVSIVSGLVWKIHRAIDEIASKIYERIDRESKEADEKRKRIYDRLDEVKMENEKKFVSKEVCGILSNTLQNDVKEIVRDMKKLLLRNGIRDDDN